MFTDWNDLHCAHGIEAARVQLLQVLDGPVVSEESPAPPEPAVARAGLDEALRRYALTSPDTKVWDADDKILIKQSQLRALLGPPVFKQWLEHESRRTVDQASVAAAVAAAKGAGGMVGWALRAYVLLYPSQTVWDRERRDVVRLEDVKVRLHRWYTDWLEHPERQEIPREHLVFDPLQRHSEADGYINMFRGLPLSPVHDESRCQAIIKLVWHLCNGSLVQVNWLLSWIALPLQQPGAKMASAILMHSDVHGSGKSLFWEAVIKPLYGDYGATLGQHQLESQYTDWRSQKLFALFEEVLGRDSKYSHTGTLKHMITGATHRVEKKFISGWEEANHMNAVFLSNEIQPFPIEPADRRMMVIWPQTKLPDDLRDQVLAEIHGGGIEAFYGFLLRRKLLWFSSDDAKAEALPFGTHTEPPVTPEKKRLIDFGRPPWDTFVLEWAGDELDVPYQTCLTGDLFIAYRRWCERRRESCLSQTKFSTLLAAKFRKRAGIRYRLTNGQEGKGAFFIVQDAPTGEGAEAQDLWLGKQVSAFRAALNRMRDEGEQL